MKEIKKQKFLGVVIMTKYILLVVIILSVVALVGCVSGTVAVGEHRTYDVKSDIKSLKIEINAADFTIVHGDKFSVESNLKYLAISEDDGVLKIVENCCHYRISYKRILHFQRHLGLTSLLVYANHNGLREVLNHRTFLLAKVNHISTAISIFILFWCDY